MRKSCFWKAQHEQHIDSMIFGLLLLESQTARRIALFRGCGDRFIVRGTKEQETNESQNEGKNGGDKCRYKRQNTKRRRRRRWCHDGSPLRWLFRSRSRPKYTGKWLWFLTRRCTRSTKCAYFRIGAANRADIFTAVIRFEATIITRATWYIKSSAIPCAWLLRHEIRNLCVRCASWSHNRRATHQTFLQHERVHRYSTARHKNLVCLLLTRHPSKKRSTDWVDSIVDDTLLTCAWVCVAMSKLTTMKRIFIVRILYSVAPEKLLRWRSAWKNGTWWEVAPYDVAY